MGYPEVAERRGSWREVKGLKVGVDEKEVKGKEKKNRLELIKTTKA